MRPVLAAFALLLVLTTPAGAAEGRLAVAGEPSRDARLTFELDEAWQPVRGEMAGTPMAGRYHLDLAGRPENERCSLFFFLHGLSVRRSQLPVLRRGVLTLQPRQWWGTHRLRIAHRERRGSARLYRTRLGARTTGIAVLPTPSWIRPVRPVTVVRVEVASSLVVLVPDGRGGLRPGVPTPEQRAACSSFSEQHLGPALRRALRSVRVERRA